MSQAPTRQVQLTATLTDQDNNPLANKTINFYYKPSSETTYTQAGSATTDSNGRATYTISVSVPGTYDFKAEFPGDDTYDASTAEVTNVTVKVKTYLTLSIQPL